MPQEHHASPPAQAISTSGWLVVNTQPHKEQFALDNLLRQHFDTYCPMLRKSVRHSRQRREVLRPLFPGYVFVVRPCVVTRWRPILSTFGVRNLVMAGAAPAVIDGRFVLALKARELEGAIVLPDTPYHAGQKVRMLGGAFDGLVATILDLDEKGRITVLLEILNQSVRVRTDLHGVRETST